LLLILKVGPTLLNPESRQKKPVGRGAKETREITKPQTAKAGD